MRPRTTKRVFFLLSVCFFLATCSAGYATVIYVDVTKTPPGDGLTWNTAYTDLGDALLLAIPGDEIWVAKGTYTPGNFARSARFQLENGVGLYGGFSGAGTETMLSERDWLANETTLSGEINAPGSFDNNYHVVSSIGNNSTAVLDGFTVSDGHASGGILPDWFWGGGIYLENSSPTLANLTFTDNSGFHGGGLYNNNSDPTLVNALFVNNFADSGGAIYNNNGSSPRLINVTYTSNLASAGPAMCNDNSSNPWLTNSIFWGHSGLGIFNVGSSSPRISYCLIEGSGGSAAWNSAYGTDLGHNIDEDPRFKLTSVAWERWGYPWALWCVWSTSPAVDAGENAEVPGGVTTDLYGKPRIFGVVDMGAYEHQGPPTGIGDDQVVPKAFGLYPNVPNPFNPTTSIRYDVPSGGGRVTLRIYNVAGRLVRTLVDGPQTAGEQRVTWNGRGDNGSGVATGVYFYCMTAPGFKMTKKMILLQ